MNSVQKVCDPEHVLNATRKCIASIFNGAVHKLFIKCARDLLIPNCVKLIFS